MRFELCLRTREAGVGNLSSQDPFGLSQRRSERLVRGIPNHHQVEVAARFGFSFHKGTVQEGKFNPPHCAESLGEHRISGSRLQNHPLEVSIQWVLSVEGIADLVADPARTQQTHIAEAPEIS